MIDTEDSNLVAHAKRELALAGVEEDVRPSIIAAVSAFASYGHSGGSASVVLTVLNDLLQFKNLTPLTDDPAEWNRVADILSNGENLWQNNRRSSAFSMDGGKTYYVLDDERQWVKRIPWFMWRRFDARLRVRLMHRFHTAQVSGR